jgi:hypothetical protein
MAERKPYSAPAAEQAGAFSELAEGLGSFLPDLLGSTGPVLQVV